MQSACSARRRRRTLTTANAVAATAAATATAATAYRATVSRLAPPDAAGEPEEPDAETLTTRVTVLGDDAGASSSSRYGCGVAQAEMRGASFCAWSW
jgi:hypothetical protein